MIDENGKIAHVLPKVDPSTHTDEMLKAMFPMWRAGMRASGGTSGGQ